MLSPVKILLAILLAAAFWYIRRRLRQYREGGGGQSGGKTIDLKQCGECGKWRNAPCKRDDCPLREN